MRGDGRWLWLCLLLGACRAEPVWQFDRLLPLGEVSPVGIAALGPDLMVSDPANNQVLRLDTDGKVLERFEGLERPMHIFAEGEKLYVPEYLTDSIRVLVGGQWQALPLGDAPNAPASVAVQGEWVAVADFYNHRVLLQKGRKTWSLGQEGHGQGDLYYPTDVAIFQDKVYVADAYNNRVQVFDTTGGSLQLIGQQDGIQTATGIALKDNQLFVTDFEGNRLLVYNLEGNLQQQLSTQLSQPSDVALAGNKMYVANYGSHSIAVFSRHNDH